MEMVDLLLRHGADPTITDFFGLTPLMAAAYKGKVKYPIHLQACRG